MDVSENTDLSHNDVSSNATTDVSNQPVNRILNVNLHMNCIIIKSDDPAIPSKAIVVSSIGGPLTEEQKADIIRREQAKMKEAAAAAPAPTEEVTSETA